MLDPESIHQLALPSPAVVFALIMFGVIGSVAFLYGRKQRKYRTMSVGIALCVYPYLTDNVWFIWLGGIALTAALFLWRDE